MRSFTSCRQVRENSLSQRQRLESSLDQVHYGDSCAPLGEGVRSRAGSNMKDSRRFRVVCVPQRGGVGILEKILFWNWCTGPPQIQPGWTRTTQNSLVWSETRRHVDSSSQMDYAGVQLESREGEAFSQRFQCAYSEILLLLLFGKCQPLCTSSLKFSTLPIAILLFIMVDHLLPQFCCLWTVSVTCFSMTLIAYYLTLKNFL